MNRSIINGELETYKFEGLLEKVKQQGQSLYTTLEYKDKTYDFTVSAVKPFTIIDENTRWYFYVHEYDEQGNCKVADISEYLNSSDDEIGLLEKDLIQKMYEVREGIKKGIIKFNM